MAAKRSKKVTVEVDVSVVKGLLKAIEALSELASTHIECSDDPEVRALGEALGKPKKKTAKKRSRR